MRDERDCPLDQVFDVIFGRCATFLILAVLLAISITMAAYSLYMAWTSGRTP